MGMTGAATERASRIWETIRGARDAAIDHIRERLAAGASLRGAEVDDVARAVVDQHGYGEYFTHRTGHSIDAREIHGSGPNLDNLETRDVRLLIPGVGFSIEPGVYIRGEIGMRTEVNGFIDGTELVITPSEYQHELIVA
jgi:Xaa-Pro aminopeptidase